MTAFIIKISAAILAFTCAIHAAPLDRRCAGSECSQSLSSGNVNLGSTTNISPITQVTPITRYQPIVQSFAPIVESENNCAEESLPSSMVDPMLYPDRRFYPNSMYGHGMYSGDDRFRFNVNRVGELSRLRFMNRMGYLNHGDLGGLDSYAVGTRNLNAIGTPVINNSGIISKRTLMTPECVPSEFNSCEQSLPVSSTDMGSLVTALPSDVVLPNTVYQGHVQSKEAEIAAAPVQHSTLRQSNVNLGSHTMILPITKVVPSTVYQPEVNQKATVVEMAPQQDQSLGRSSVSLGSTVTIRPTTTVEPLTIFQPKIQSLPFIIHDEACQEEPSSDVDYMDIYSGSPEMSTSVHSEISIDRQSDGICLSALEARVEEGCQGLSLKIQINREKLWELYLEIIALDGPFPRGQRRALWAEMDSADMIPLDRITVIESADILPPVSLDSGPTIWIDNEQLDPVRLDSEATRSARKGLCSVVITVLSYISNQAFRCSKFAGTNLLLGLIPVAGPIICALLFYLRVHRRIKSLEIGRPAQAALINKAWWHMVKQFLIALFFPVAGAVYNRAMQWNHASYEKAEELVLDHRNANLEFISFRNEVFNWTAQQRGEGAATPEPSPSQEFITIEIPDGDDLQQDDLVPSSVFSERGDAEVTRGIQAWVESQVHFLSLPGLSKVLGQDAVGSASHVFPQEVAPITLQGSDPSVLNSMTSKVIAPPQQSSSTICCRRPLIFDSPTMDPASGPDPTSGSVLNSSLDSSLGGGSVVNAVAEGCRPLQEMGSSLNAQILGGDGAGQGVASSCVDEHDTDESSDDEQSEPRRDKGKGRAVDPPPSPTPSEELFMLADPSAAGPSSLGANRAANNPGLLPAAPATVVDYGDPRGYSYPLGSLLTPAMAEMESQRKEFPYSALQGTVRSPLDKLISVFNRLSELTPSTSSTAESLPGSQPRSSPCSSTPRAAIHEEIKLEEARRCLLEEILESREIDGADPSFSNVFAQFDSLRPTGDEVRASSQDATQGQVQVGPQDQLIVDGSSCIPGCHSEHCDPTTGPNDHRLTPDLAQPTTLGASASCSSTNGHHPHGPHPTGLPHPPPGRMYVYIRMTDSYAAVPAPRNRAMAREQAAQTQRYRFFQDEAQSLRKYKGTHLDYRGIDFEEEDREVAQAEYQRYLASLPQPPRFYIDSTPEGTVAASSNRTLNNASSQWDFNSEDQAMADRNEQLYHSLHTPPPRNFFRRTKRSISVLWKSTLHVLKIKKKKGPTGGNPVQQETETEAALSSTTTLVCSEALDALPGRMAMEATTASLGVEGMQEISSLQERLPSPTMPSLVLPAPPVSLDESQSSSSSQPHYSLPTLPSLVLTAPFVPPEENRPGLHQNQVAAQLLAPLDIPPPYAEIDPTRVWAARSSEDIDASRPPTYAYVVPAVRRNRLGVPRARRLPAHTPVTPIRAHIRDRRTSGAILLSAPSTPARPLVQDRQEMENLVTAPFVRRRSLQHGPFHQGPSRFRQARHRQRVPIVDTDSMAKVPSHSSIVRRPAFRIASTSSSSNAATIRRPLIDLIPSRTPSRITSEIRHGQSISSGASRLNATSSWRPLIDLIPTRTSSNIANEARRSAAMTHRPLIDLIPTHGSHNTVNEPHPTAARPNVVATQRPLVGPALAQASHSVANATHPAAAQFHSSSAFRSNETTADRPSVGPAHTQHTQHTHNAARETHPLVDQLCFNITGPSNEASSTSEGNFARPLVPSDTNISPEVIPTRNRPLSAYSFATAGRYHYSSSQVSINSDNNELEHEEEDSEKDDGEGNQSNHQGNNGDNSGDSEEDRDDDENAKADTETDVDDEEKDEDTDDTGDDDSSDSDHGDAHRGGEWGYCEALSSYHDRPDMHNLGVNNYELELPEPPRVLRVTNPDPISDAETPDSAASDDGVARAWQQRHARPSSPTLLLCAPFTPTEDDSFQRTCHRRRGRTPLPDQAVLNSFESWIAQSNEDEAIRPPYLGFASCPVPPTIYPSREDAARKIHSRCLGSNSQRSNLSRPPLVAESVPEIVPERAHRTRPMNPVSASTNNYSQRAFTEPVDSAPADKDVTEAERRVIEKQQWRRAQDELWASFGLTYYHNSDGEADTGESNIAESSSPSNQEQARAAVSNDAQGREAERVDISPGVAPNGHQWLLESLESLSSSSSSGYTSSQLQVNPQVPAMSTSTGPVRSDGRPWSASAAQALQAASQIYPIQHLDQEGNSSSSEFNEEQFRYITNRQRQLQTAQALIFMVKKDMTQSQCGRATTPGQSSSSSSSTARGQVHLETVAGLTAAVGSMEIDNPFVNVAPPVPAQVTPLTNFQTLDSPHTLGLEQVSGPHTVSPIEALVSTPSDQQMNTEYLTFQLNNVVMAEAERAYFGRADQQNGVQTDGVVRALTFASAYQEPVDSEHGLPEIPLQRSSHSKEQRK
ncbi:hypothetical protein EMPS_09619 [Entomortierella parvispora]|uniref:Uncharacterized protein n=1 Tax=Entomortierella parvispora TaxID=205924 RepID=A0A9P3M0R9_9FUNG|nr:hypothetical protein EMPS_09619 [Entomortierella parvispora]